MSVSLIDRLTESVDQVCGLTTLNGLGFSIEMMKDKMKTISKLLLDAENEIHGNSETRAYVCELKYLIYDADDLFDEITTYAALSSESESSLSKVRYLFNNNNFTITRNLRQLMQQMDALILNFPYPTEFKGVDVDVDVDVDKEKEYANIDIVGRENDKRCLLDMLLASDISSVAIVGMGGLGKTALAQLVYNDDQIINHFDLRIWVCVPENNFDLKFLISQLVNSLSTQRVSPELGLTQLKDLLRQTLSAKKYLLVLDHVWNEDRVSWLTFKNTLFRVGGAAKGSRILITTRSLLVPQAVRHCAVYELKLLSEADSWTLFQRVAFTGLQETKDETLVRIGQQIVKSCAHLPLAITVVGSLLYAQGLDKWRQFERIGLSKVHQFENPIMSVLKLSYNQLPSPLKNCFAYCSLFPKDYSIHKNRLIRLWIAEGFIHPVGYQSLEELGESYFTALLQRSFFQDLGLGISGEIVSVKMHDLMHDLAQAVAGDEFQLLSSNSSTIHEKARHLSISYFEGDLFRSSCLSISKGIRTLLNFSHPAFKHVASMHILFHFKSLRVIALEYSSVTCLPSTIGELIHLRYLSLSYSSQLELLPSALVNLVNLQTLVLRECSKLKHLPCDFSKLVNLRHLNLHGCYRLTHMPLGMKYLTSLCELDMFVVGDANSVRSFESLEELKYLQKLRGDLTVRFLELPGYNALKTTAPEYLRAKVHLTDIYIHCINGNALQQADDKRCEALLQCLEPHPSLKSLSVEGYAGVRFPSWSSLNNSEKSSSNLVKICIEDCPRLQHLPVLSKLFHLRQLKLYKLKDLEYIENSSKDFVTSRSLESSCFFPSLESLELANLPKLRGWSTLMELQRIELLQQEKNVIYDLHSLPVFPRLCELNIEKCPKLTSFPICENIRQLHLYSFNDALQLIISRSPQLLQHFSALARVTIDNVGFLKLIAVESYEHISSLIIHLSDLEWFSLDEVFDRDMLSLRSLEIRLSAKLKSISGIGCNHLVALQSLRLSNLPNLHLSTMTADGEEDLMPWDSLQGLLHLELDYLPKLVKLPKGIQYLRILHTFEIRSCHNLKELPEWIGCLNKLQSLCIEACTGLMCLPDSMLDLTALRNLEITRCSEFLLERCRGEGLHKIQHIPHILIV